MMEVVSWIQDLLSSWHAWGQASLVYIRDDSSLSSIYGSYWLWGIMYLTLAYDAFSHVPQIVRNLRAHPDHLKGALAISQIIFNCGLGFLLVFVIGPIFADPILVVNGINFFLVYGISWTIYVARTRHL